jgi:hypothetical protein
MGGRCAIPPGARVHFAPVRMTEAQPRSPRYLSEQERVLIADLRVAALVPLPISSVSPSRYRVLRECEPGEPGVWLEDVASARRWGLLPLPALAPRSAAVSSVLSGAAFRPRLLPADALCRQRLRSDRPEA